MNTIKTRKDLTYSNLINNVESIFIENGEKFKIEYEVNTIEQITFILSHYVIDYDYSFRLVEVVFTNYWAMIRKIKNIINK